MSLKVMMEILLKMERYMNAMYEANTNLMVVESSQMGDTVYVQSPGDVEVQFNDVMSVDQVDMDLSYMEYLFYTSVELVSWRFCHNQLTSDDAIKKKGICFASRGSLCHKDEESPEHLFNSCDFAKSLWMKVGEIFNVNIPSFKSTNVMVNWWTRKGRIVVLRRIWSCLLFVVCNIIWNSHNENRYRAFGSPKILRNRRHKTSFLNWWSF
ncbi:hypothetical protein NE237_013789 [Protea cynaroides]|uniref:Reverse transcriptase zinc-binding domain-containing protein n=1 Tax=Protea cynaroides TaxID=273540 RepID=A0A9Q0GZC3_9MAGN|nr:hypothetical protein NE237_013789 [Protea cynaroides]